MGTGKKEASRRDREGKKIPGNIRVKGENFYRTAKQVKQLNVYKEGKPVRDAQGNITKAAAFQSRDVPTAVIEPNRKWFQNSRVISQESLTAFRTAMAEQAKDPNRFLLKSAKLPMSLIRDDGASSSAKAARPALVDSFSDVFGSKATRKRVTMKNFSTLDDLADSARKSISSFHDRRTSMLQNGLLGAGAGDGAEAAAGEVDAATGEVDDTDYVPPEVGHEDEEAPPPSALMEPVFSKGQSRRIWNELYRTIDSSDVIIHVLDARDPLGTTCRSIQDYLRKEAPHCDLIPSGVAARWVKTLQKTVPTCAFRASVTNPFGKGSLISLLRQFSSLHADRKQISVGLVGYPNVGKSSVLNTLLGKKSCTVAPIPGETKVWQFVRLMRRIYLIDCPGIVPPDSHATAEDILLRGAVRTEKVYNPAQYIAAVLRRTKKHHLARTYELKDWEDAVDFLEQLSRKRGRLLAGGEADIDGMARIVLNDFLRGKIPWFTAPPSMTPEEDKEANMNGRAGRLGEMPKKRKREDADSEPGTSMGPSSPGSAEEDDGEKGAAVADEDDPKQVEEDDDEDFDGFGSDSAPSYIEDSDDDSGGTDGNDVVDDMISLGSASDDGLEEGDEEEEDGGDVAEAEKAGKASRTKTLSRIDRDPPPKLRQKAKAKRQKR
ncbi:nucleolar GTP-binding protein [Niveomyces insectorum RCEF 264]|uniref:Nucleolar GTP-binding protein 2 n=1 Tax=Niveomyces insectorum RCEF 264 TaxID=1081102 RepID=A0A162MEC7_9HYPO|nr:nucleolar GTP-binding protein [Niveomyces insectorum RCEF 264]